MQRVEARLKAQAQELGFELVGIAPATPADGFDQLREWLDHGYAGEMAYMHKHGDARRHPESILPEVRSVVMVGMCYAPAVAFSSGAAHVARYAVGADYHDVLRHKLNDLLAWVRTEIGNCRGRSVVDTAPLLERDFARRAGLGWFGKNTMLLNKRLGSYFLLGALLLDLDLQPDPIHETQHCGTCTACVEACPTAAFVAPHQLDARKCISYLTIELRGAIATELCAPMGDWLFGCDICQEVCPWNRKAPATNEPAFQPRPELVSLEPRAVLELSEADFRRVFRGTALWRSKRSGLRRNAAIVLGNRGEPGAIPVLERAAQDEDPVVREAAAWALERIQAKAATPPALPCPRFD
jgi:epoxyqueuosine reductase